MRGSLVGLGGFVPIPSVVVGVILLGNRRGLLVAQTELGSFLR